MTSRPKNPKPAKDQGPLGLTAASVGGLPDRLISPRPATVIETRELGGGVRLTTIVGGAPPTDGHETTP
jgi:hypothetical protein